MIYLLFEVHFEANPVCSKMNYTIILLSLLVIGACVVGVLALPTTAQQGDKKVVCYYGSWATYRPGKGKFDVEHIDPFICTHIVYGFIGLSHTNEVLLLDPYNDLEENWGKGAMKRFNGLRKLNPSLKTIVAVGGWNEGSEKYSKMAQSPASRRTFINSVVDFMILHDFDGFDLDWEYPANREGAMPEDKENFVSLVQEIKVEFVKYGFLLTAAVAAGEDTIRTAYDIPAIAKEFDYICLMAYDFHGAWEDFTGHNSPLRANPYIDFNDSAKLSTDHAVRYWLDQGMPAEKLILGMGSYGRGFFLDNPSENGLYAPAKNGIRAGPYTQQEGIWGYNEICEFFKAQPGQWTIVEDLFYQAPYAYNGRDWIGYDTPQSIKTKSEYALEMGLGGGMVWSLETEDFHGECGGETFPLVKTMYRTLNGPYPPNPTTTTTTPDPNQPTTAAPLPTPPVSEICKVEGNNADPHAEPCSATFYECVSTAHSWIIHERICAPGTFFHPESRTCTFPHNIPGCQ